MTHHEPFVKITITIPKTTRTKLNALCEAHLRNQSNMIQYLIEKASGKKGLI